MLERILNLQSVALLSAAESLLVIKLLPEHLASYGHLVWVAVVFGANFALLALYSAIIYPLYISPLRHLKGPKLSFTVIGRGLMETTRPPGEIYIDLAKRYPAQDVLAINVLQRHYLVMRPGPLADLLVHRSYDFVKPPRISAFLRHVLGDGLIITEGETHRFLRKNTLPAFSFRHVRDLYPMMWGKSVEFVEALGREVSPGDGVESGSGSVVELSGWASRVTLDIIGVAGLGHEFGMLRRQPPSSSEKPDGNDGAAASLHHIFEQLLEPAREKVFFFLVSTMLGLGVVRWLPWGMNGVFNSLTGSLRGISEGLVREKREAVAKGADEHFDVLSLLIKSENFSDGELRDQLLTFLAAGHETTASSLSWACFLLAQHPEYQESLRKEVRSAGLPLDGSPTATTEDLASTLEQLPLLNGIMNETFRLYPTVPATMREAIRDTQVGDLPIPKGTNLVLSTWLMNRSPEVWGASAAEFVPERWIDEEDDGSRRPNQTGGAGSNYEFLTFLHGPRSCIGQGFARAEMRCMLACLVGRFSWELAMEEAAVLPRGVITIKPANGLYLSLKPLEV